MESTYNGVRAEPKFLKDPTSLESISSGISRLSSYVTSNLPKRRQNMTSPMDTYYAPPPPPPPIEDIEQDHDDDNTDIILFSAFDSIELNHDKRNCLLLGYNDGFQIWDVSDPDNVHELYSVRDKDRFGSVTYIHCVSKTEEQQGPLLAIVSEVEKKKNDNNDNNTQYESSSKASIVRFYSLQTQEIVKEMSDFDDDEDDTIVTCIQSNHRVIVLGCLSRNRSSLHIISAIDFKLSSTLTDVYHENGPIFTLGTRFIAYATNTPVLNSDPVMSSLTNKGLGFSGVLQGDKDVKGAAKDIAKEVVSGVKSLSELGYSTLSNYFNNGQTDKVYTISPTNNNRRNSASPRQPETFNSTNTIISGSNSNSNSSSSNKKLMPSGMIMIRDLLKIPTSPRHLSSSIVAHFRPHTHPLSCLAFNKAGTLLISASTQGHTFHVFSILITANQGNVTHLYSLSRGFTDAQVEDCQFSIDSTWCAVSTARGTTHVYAINPYGGKPEIAGHVHGKVNNPIFHHPLYNNKKQTKAVSLNSVIRIKQRRKMPSENVSFDDVMKSPPYYNPTSLHYPMLISNKATETRAKITSMFVSAPKSPFNTPTPKKTVSTSSASLDSIKQQATNMLSSFGSTLSQNRISPPPVKWNNNEKSSTNDSTLMFGFDEEYDDSTKMVNDEFGYQDIYSFHPDGILTLHRCWIVKVVLKKRDNGRVIEKVDLSVKEEDIAEWKVARNPDWEQVMMNTPPTSPKKNKKTIPKQQKIWLSNAEIATYIPDEPALWTQHQFSFQTFKQKDVERVLKAGLIPQTETLVMLKGMPEPISSRIDRVKKTSTRIADDNAEENMDDALAELEDNISSAMQTAFSPSPNNNSPAKWFSSSANAISPTTPRSMMDQHSSVSFEDAYLIHMASDPIATSSNMQHSSLIQFDDSPPFQDDDSIRFEQSQEDEESTKKVFSPDGDNEVAYPSDSVFGGSFSDDKQSDSTSL